MTVYADSITAAQRIKLDRKPEDGNMEEAAFLQELKERGYSWKGYGDKGSWNGTKDTVDAWEDPAFRARVKKNVRARSFYDTKGTQVNMATYIEHIKNVDESAIDDDLDDMPASNVAPSAPNTPAKPASSSKRARS